MDPDKLIHRDPGEQSAEDSLAGKLAKGAVRDVIATILRWRHADIRLLFGGFVLFLLVAFRIAAIFIDVDQLQTYLEIERQTGFTTGGGFQTTNCRPVTGLLLGNDRNGYALSATLVEATQAFFVPALLSCGIALFFGTFFGAVAGYFRGGFVESSTKLMLTVIAAYPRLILVIVAVGFFVAYLHDPGRAVGMRLFLMATMLGIAYVPVLALAIYQKVGAFQREEFIEAARAHGLSDTRILGYHILWANCMPVLARHFFYLFGYFILVETSLSYLGPEYGVPGSIPSWGNLLAGCSKGELMSAAVLGPSVAIVGSILGLTFLGDAVGERFERGRT
ncbi:MAG: ABC transporter permease [Deltaproteobacteria bacterium]|nr:ABC transporter permease [Deltaproteobacteria bacterium]